METYKKFKNDLFFIVSVYVFITMVFNAFTFGFDNTDNIQDKKRSGMVLYTDNLTGCQYLKGGLFGGMIKRYDRNGKHICIIK